MPRTAKQMQMVTEEPPKQEQKIRITVYEDSSFHYELVLPASAVLDLLDPEVPDAFIEVPIPKGVTNVKVRYLHTSRIAKIDVHDDLPKADDGDTGKKPAVKVEKVDKGG